MKNEWITKSLLTLVLLSAPTFYSPLAQAGGNGVGNGGIAYVCRDDTRKIVRAELLDLWEPETHKIVRSSASIEDQIEMAASRITERFPGRLKPLLDGVQEMRSKILMTDRTLAPTEDALPNFTPDPGCAYEQVARYTWINDLGAERLLIHREIFDSPAFSDTDRAALFVHETLYARYMKGIEAANRWWNAPGELGQNSTTLRLHQLPSTSQIVRQVVQAAFWRQGAVSLREDLVTELRWILVDAWTYFGNPAGFPPALPLYRMEATKATLTFRTASPLDGKCLFEFRDLSGTPMGRIEEVDVRGDAGLRAQADALTRDLKGRLPGDFSSYSRQTKAQKKIARLGTAGIGRAVTIRQDLMGLTPGGVIVSWTCSPFIQSVSDMLFDDQLAVNGVSAGAKDLGYAIYATRTSGSPTSSQAMLFIEP
jgi:hypothetical protein